MSKIDVVNPILTYLIPTLLVILTWVGSVYLFSIQHTKSVQSKWLDSFREQMAELLSEANRITPRSLKDELLDFSKPLFSLQLLLDEEHIYYKEFTYATETMLFYVLNTSPDDFNSSEYTQTLEGVVKVFRLIMRHEQKQMRRMI